MAMLNYETLLSSYDDKLTLMQWLKKVEAALKDASAVGFSVNKKGSATISFEIDFEDGSKLESGDIVLQQGESVASAYISSGNLHLVLTNGDDLDAGNMFNGNVNITGTLTASGNVTFSGDLSVANDLVVLHDADITGDLTASNSISSPDISAGKITTPIITTTGSEISAQKPIVELMSGYSFTKQASLNWQPVYVSVVKNANKVTFVVFGTYTYATGDSAAQIGYFVIPSSLGEKLYPYTIGNIDKILDQRNVDFFKNDNIDSEAKLVKCETAKGSNTYITINFRRLAQAGLEDNSTYVFRYEVTFLLSDNLVGA